MSSQSSEFDFDAAIEELTKKYLARRNLVSWNQTSRDAEKCPHPVCSAHSGSASSSGILQEMCNVAADQCDGLNEKSDSVSSLADSETGRSVQEPMADSRSFFCTETDVTLPSSPARTLGCRITRAVAHSGGKRRKKKTQIFPHTWSSSPVIGQVYHEMLEIYDKLQKERMYQQHWAAQLQEQERQLNQRESLLLRRQDTLCKIREVEDEVRRRVCELQELSDLNEQSKRLEVQWRKEQARLENLQRKYEYSVARKGRENIAPKAQGSKWPKEDKPLMPAKPVKAQELPLHGLPGPSTCKLLVQILDWVSDSYLTPAEDPEPKISSAWDCERPTSIQERCSKVLPLLTEQLQVVQMLDRSFHVPLLRFVYWSLRQLDSSPQRGTLTSTLRRLGEEVCRGTALRGPSSDPDGPHRTRPPPFFKSSSLHTRFLSTLILLQTTSQADILAQALDCLHSDVQCEEGRVHFLQYQALPVVLAYLQSSNRGLLSLAVDILMQMNGESWQLSSFMEACSTEDFFRCVSLLLRNPRLEVPVVEKVSILLQKLSKIRKNKRLFEIHGIHLRVQEMHRTADPAHAFLAINLSSILFNLGMMKKTPVSPIPP
ncbi:coiled-coil domain-containing protein 138-like [Scleropages formosus]|uniref:Coiled-coil domain-containing protein 138-like n=1 Tax=Scleropages formosus TaxID=113540 RepID=A0A0P7XD30_SCLFO|nr:coiled-coil domain-containing protein 138-like [Scleropages formosus]